MATLIVLVLLTSLVPSHVILQKTSDTQELTKTRYWKLIDAYRKRDFTGPVNELGTWPALRVASASKDLMRYIARVRAKPTLSSTKDLLKLRPHDQDLMAAVMLHTQVAILSQNSGRLDLRDVHLEAGRAIFTFVKENAFRRSWPVAIAYLHQTNLEKNAAVTILQDLVSEFPLDTELLLALGTVHESYGAFVRKPRTERFPASPLSANDRRFFLNRLRFRGENRRNLFKARDYFRRCLELDPEHTEAHLRLGHVLELLGEDKEAMEHLDWVVEHNNDRYRRGMALLFRGRHFECREAVDHAIEDYRAAVDTVPEWQIMHVALAHALHRSGALAASRRSLEQGLRRPLDLAVPKSGRWYYYFKNDESIRLLTQIREWAF